MISKYIYINQLGVPCAPTRGIPLSWQDDKDVYVKILMDKIKAKSIPILEDDRQWVFLQCNTKQALQYKPDSFIEINPYEFEVKTIGVEVPNGHYVTLFKTRAHIIRPSEPKADPKEKEIEIQILKILESDQVHNHWQRYNELAGYMENEKTFDYERAAKQIAEYFTICLNREL